MRNTLLDFLLFHIKGSHKQFSTFSKKNPKQTKNKENKTKKQTEKAKPLNACERIVFNKFQVYSLQMYSKLTTSQVVFKNFACLLGTAISSDNSFLVTGQDHVHNMRA